LNRTRRERKKQNNKGRGKQEQGYGKITLEENFAVWFCTLKSEVPPPVALEDFCCRTK